MKCDQVEFGTYGCAYNIMLPWLTKDPCAPSEPLKPYTAAIDKCLLPEILKLWEMGIKTTGCCCGHGKRELAFIGVLPEYIPRMKELGYEVQFNSCRPNDEDSFVPKTELQYGSIDKGFNWWDKQLFPDDPMPVNTLMIKWKRKYPSVPKPEFSQVCDGYSCMWCGRCPSGEYWKCPDEDLAEYEEYKKRFEEWKSRHPDFLDQITIDVEIR